jgi:hypothetical protein
VRLLVSMNIEDIEVLVLADKSYQGGLYRTWHVSHFSHFTQGLGRSWSAMGRAKLTFQIIKIIFVGLTTTLNTTNCQNFRAVSQFGALGTAVLGLSRAYSSVVLYSSVVVMYGMQLSKKRYKNHLGMASKRPTCDRDGVWCHKIARRHPRPLRVKQNL